MAAAQTSQTAGHRVGYFIGRLLAFAFVTAIIGALAYGALAGLSSLATDKGLIWSAVVGVIVWAIKASYERTVDRDRQLAASRQEMYKQFLEFVNTQVGSARAIDEKINAPQVDLALMRLWSMRLGLVGSDSVVRAWNEFRNDSHAANGDSAAVLKRTGQLLLAMRKDCGHHDTRLKPIDMLRLFVNDLR